MGNNKNRRVNNEIQLKEVLTRLDDLIEEIQVQEVDATSDFDPDAEFDSNHINEERIRLKTVDFLHSLKKAEFPGENIQYSRITKRIFSKKNTFEGVELIAQRIQLVIEKDFQDELLVDDVLERRVYKILDHIQLASFQIGEIIQHSKDESEKLRKELVDSKAEFESMKSDLQTEITTTKKEISGELTKIYIQFVTILGIFTAIVLSVFGGLQVITSAFENLHAVPIWKSVLIGSVVSIAVLSMLFLLTRWVTTIVNKSFGHESERSLMQILTNNGAFATGIFIFSYLIIASVIFSSNEATTSFKDIINGGNAIPALILLGLPILGGAAVFIKTIDLRKYK